MQKQKKTRAGSTYAAILQIMLLIAMLGIIAPAIYGLKPEVDFLMILTAILMAFIVSINLHELGHLIFGKLFGFRLLSYQILLFNWTNQNGSMKFSLRNVKGLSGYCAMAPSRGMPLMRHAAYFAGGITLNTFTGVLSVLLLTMFPISGFWALFMIVFAGVSLYLGLVNLVPFYLANNASDGMLFWSIIFKRPLAKKLVEYNEIITQLYGGTRPSEIDIYIDADDESFMLRGVLQLYRYFKALDSGDITQTLDVARWLEENTGSLPSTILPPVYYELCYMGCIENDIAKAKTYFEKAGKILSSDMDANGLRVKAYYAYYAERDSEKALELCEKAMSVADRFPIRGQGIMEKALVLKLRETIAGREA